MSVQDPATVEAPDMPRPLRAPLIALVVISIVLGITTTGTVQFVGIMVAIAITLLWWIRVAPSGRTKPGWALVECCYR